MPERRWRIDQADIPVIHLCHHRIIASFPYTGVVSEAGPRLSQTNTEQPSSQCRCVGRGQVLSLVGIDRCSVVRVKIWVCLACNQIIHSYDFTCPMWYEVVGDLHLPLTRHAPQSSLAKSHDIPGYFSLLMLKAWIPLYLPIIILQNSSQLAKFISELPHFSIIRDESETSTDFSP